MDILIQKIKIRIKDLMNVKIIWIESIETKMIHYKLLTIEVRWRKETEDFTNAFSKLQRLFCLIMLLHLQQIFDENTKRFFNF